jgi:hypothetical protein
VAIICIWSWKNYSGVKGGGIGSGWSVLWLFCPCWPEPVPVLLVLTICLQQNKIYEKKMLCSYGNETLEGYDREKEYRFYPQRSNSIFDHLIQVCIKVVFHEQV